MTTYTIADFFKILTNDHVSFAYRGSFSNSVLAMATDLIKHSIEEEHARLRNKLSFLMIESFQNIARYADSNMEITAPNSYSDFFMTRNIGATFYIISANLIDNSKIEFVRKKLEVVNTLNLKELNKFYREVLTNRVINTSGGAGLGFIEMVRKSKGKLPFDFVKIDDKKSMFFMQIQLTNPKSSSKKEIVPLEDAKKIQKLLSQEKILMMHKGSFSQNAVGPVLKMVEDNMYSMKLRQQKKVFHFLVEMLQNISKHSYVLNNEREGIFFIGFKNGQFNIGTGNYIANDEIENLKSKLDHVNSLSRDDLNTLYRKYLREGRPLENKNSAGLGLIDLARDTDDKINYSFNSINEKYSFFSITVKC